MATFVIDASVFVKWFVPETGSEAARALLNDGDHYVAPDLLFAEAANTVWKKIRRGELSRDEGRLLMDDIVRTAVDTVPARDLACDAIALAAAADRPVYDAMYLALAVRLGTQLVTADERFRNAIAAIPLLAPHVRLLSGP